jgi:preprotein translocase SecE subunit
MARDRQRQRRRRPNDPGRDVGLPADDAADAGLGGPDPDGPLGQAMPDMLEARLAEEGAEPPSVGGRGGRGPVEEHEVVHATGPRKGIFGRAADFIRASWNELKRVQWPDRRQVGQGTAVVVGFVIVAGLYLGALDAIWNPIIQKIL